MSHDATNWAIKQRGLKPAAKIVLWHLCDRFHPDFGCFPSQDTLAEDCELSRSTLNVHLADLEAAGLIGREQRRRKGSERQESTRYRFPFEADFHEIFGQKPCPETGHGCDEAVSENDADPCPENAESRVRNPDSNPVREPVKEPVKEREARERVSEKNQKATVTSDLIHRVQRFVSGQGFKGGEWKGWGSSTIGHIAKQFAALTDEEQDAACAHRDEFLAKCRRDGGRPMPVANYFRDRVWMMLEGREAAPVKIDAPAYGPAWSAIVFERLLDGPIPLGPPDVTRESRSQAYEALIKIRGLEKAQEFYRRMGFDFDTEGRMLFAPDFEYRQEREYRAKHGFPAVNAMYGSAENGRHGLSGDEAERGQALAHLMEFVVTGSPLYQEWQREFDERGWPWPKAERMRGLYLPAGGPEAINDFMRAIRNDEHGS